MCCLFIIKRTQTYAAEKKNKDETGYRKRSNINNIHDSQCLKDTVFGKQKITGNGK